MVCSNDRHCSLCIAIHNAPLRSFQSSITIELQGTASFCGVHFERLDTADAKQIAEIYRKHWSIETAFQELEAHLHSEINSLGYPKAALFGFCTALVVYNVLAVVKATLRSQHGEEKIANDVSGYYLAGHLARTYEGMMIAIPEE